MYKNKKLIPKNIIFYYIIMFDYIFKLCIIVFFYYMINVLVENYDNRKYIKLKN